VERARVDGQPRIVHQAYLGTAEKVAALVQDRTSPVPLSAPNRPLYLARIALAGPRSGPAPAHYLLLAAIHRVYQPGPKTAVAEDFTRIALIGVDSLPVGRCSI
jgi:hypothetical protein